MNQTDYNKFSICKYCNRRIHKSLISNDDWRHDATNKYECTFNATPNDEILNDKNQKKFEFD
jgi:hypothetical protein